MKLFLAFDEGVIEDAEHHMDYITIQEAAGLAQKPERTPRHRKVQWKLLEKKAVQQSVDTGPDQLKQSYSPRTLSLY